MTTAKFHVPLAVSSTGATAAARFAGGTTSGAPVSGTFATGDFVIAENGHVWVCTAGGTPGTWADVGGGGGGLTTDWGAYRQDGTTVIVPTATPTAMTFALQTGTALLDLTTPDNPTFVSDGFYAINWNAFNATAGPAGSQVNLEIQGDPGGGNAFKDTTFPLDTTGDFASAGTTLVTGATAGDAIQCILEHNAGGNITFQFQVYLSVVL